MNELENARALERRLQDITARLAALDSQLITQALVDTRISREITAVERMAIATAIFVAALQPDPLAACQTLREMALDSIPLDDQGSTDAARQPLERMLAWIEAAIARGKRA